MTSYLVTVTVTVEAVAPQRKSYETPGVGLDQAKILKTGEFSSKLAAGQIALDVTRNLTKLIEAALGEEEPTKGAAQ